MIAIPARTILGKYKIGIHSATNTIFIKYYFHKHLHRKEYYLSVNALVMSYQSSRSKVIRVLSIMKEIIRGFDDVLI